jgi:uncharacterized membrane protein YozB (DUF420 family)
MPLLLILGYTGSPIFDVQLGSGYWVLNRVELGWLFAGYLALVGGAYWLLEQRNRRPHWALTLIQLLATVGFFVLVLTYSGWVSEYRGELIEQTQAQAIETIYQRFQWRQSTLAVAGLFFALAQLSFLVNAGLAERGSVR